MGGVGQKSVDQGGVGQMSVDQGGVGQMSVHYLFLINLQVGNTN